MRSGSREGRWHEEIVFDYLCDNLPEDYRLLTNRVISRSSAQHREFDLILLGRYTVYVIEIKHIRAAEVRGNAVEWRWDSYLPSEGERVIPSPLNQVDEQWKTLLEKFSAAGLGRVFVSGLVCVYGEERVELNFEDAPRKDKAYWYKDLPAFFEKEEELALVRKRPEILIQHPRLEELVNTNFSSHHLEKRGAYEIEDLAWEAPLYEAFYAHRSASPEQAAPERVLLKEYRKDLYSPQELQPFLQRLKERAEASLQQLTQAEESTGGAQHIFISPIDYFLDQGQYLTVSNWVEGQPLSYLLKKSSLAFKYKTIVAAQICRGLAYLHSAQVFHRNLNLENILWNPAERRIRLINLDFAKLPGKGTVLNTQTVPLYSREVGGEKGKYLAPELRSPAQTSLPPSTESRYHNANARTDLYSLGVILLELFTNPLKPGELVPAALDATASLNDGIRDIIQTYCSEEPIDRVKISLLDAAEILERIANNDAPQDDLFSLKSGSSLGFYEIEAVLHGGAKNQESLSIVYLARDITRPGQKVVIKLQKSGAWGDKIPNELWQSIQILEEIDTQYTARLLSTHKAYVTKNKVFLQPQKGAREAYYQVWEYIPGDDLDSWLNKQGAYAPPDVSPEKLEERLRIGLGVLKALAALHRKGWIHQDIKPKNFMRTPDGQIKIIDFGLSKRESETREAKGGTPGYIPPEAFSRNEWTLRGDVWACGCLLTSLLTGRNFDRSLETQKQVSDAVARKRYIDFLGEEIIRVLSIAIREEPEERYDSAEKFLRDYEDALGARKQQPQNSQEREAMDDTLQKLKALAQEKNDMGDIDAWGEIQEDILAYEPWLKKKQGPCPIDLKKYGFSPASEPPLTPQAVKEIISALQEEDARPQPESAPKAAEARPQPKLTPKVEAAPKAEEASPAAESPAVSDSDLSRAAAEQADAQESSLRRSLTEARQRLAAREWRAALGLADSLAAQTQTPAIKAEIREIYDQARGGLTAALQESINLGDSARAAGELDEARRHYLAALALEEDAHARRALQEIEGLFQAQLSESRLNALRAGLKDRKDLRHLGEAVYEAEALDGEGKLPAELAGLAAEARREYDALRKAHGEETTQMRFGDLQARSDAVDKLRERVATGEKLIYDATTNTEKDAYELLREANSLLTQASEDAAQYELNIAEKSKDTRPRIARERLEKALTQPFSEQFLRKLQEKLDEVNGFVRAQEKAEGLQAQASSETDDLQRFSLLLQAAQTFRVLPGLEEQTEQARLRALAALAARQADALLGAEQALKMQDYARARESARQAETSLALWPESEKPAELTRQAQQAASLRQRIDALESAWAEYQKLAASIRQQVSDPNRRAAALDLFRSVSEDPRFDFPDRRILTSEIDQYKGVGEQLTDAQTAKGNGDWSRVFDITDKVLKAGKAGPLAEQFRELYADAVTELNLIRAQELLGSDDVFEANNIFTAMLSKEERERGKARRENLEKRLEEEIKTIRAAINEGRTMQALFDQAADALGVRDLTLFRLYTRPAAALRLAKVGAEGVVNSPEMRAEINRLKHSGESADPEAAELMARAAQELLEVLAKKGMSERLRALKMFRHAGGDKNQLAEEGWQPFTLSLVTAEARRAARLVSDSLRRDVYEPLNQQRQAWLGKEPGLSDEELRSLAFSALGLRQANLLETETERNTGRWAEVEWGKRQARAAEAANNWSAALGLWRDLNTHHPNLPEVQQGLRRARIQEAIQQAHLLGGSSRGEEALALLQNLLNESDYGSAVELHQSLAEIAAGLGNFEQAASSLDLAARLAQDEGQRASLEQSRQTLEIRKITDSARASIERENLREVRPAEALRLLKNAIESLQAKNGLAASAQTEAQKAVDALLELKQIVFERAQSALLQKAEQQQASGSNEGKIQAVVALVDLQTLEEQAEISNAQRRSIQGMNSLREDLARVAAELTDIAAQFEPAGMSLPQALVRARELSNRLQTFDNIRQFFSAQLGQTKDKLDAARNQIGKHLSALTELEKKLQEANAPRLWDDAINYGNFQPLEQYKTAIDNLGLGGLPEVAAFRNRFGEMQELYNYLLDTIQAIKRAFSVSENYEDVRRLVRESQTQPSSTRSGHPWKAIQQPEYEQIRLRLNSRLRVTDIYGEGEIIGWDAVEQAADQRALELEQWEKWDKACAFKMDAAWQALQLAQAQSSETPHRIKRAKWVEAREAASLAVQALLQSAAPDLAAEPDSAESPAPPKEFIGPLYANQQPVAVRSKAARDFQKEGKSRLETASQWLHQAETQILILDNVLTEQGFPTQEEFASAASQKDLPRLERLLARAENAGMVTEEERKRVSTYKLTLQRLHEEKEKKKFFNLF
ncbi:MAG: hypothetical protein Fur0035_06670 [Anaerolineales bacterium]